MTAYRHAESKLTKGTPYVFCFHDCRMSVQYATIQSMPPISNIRSVLAKRACGTCGGGIAAKLIAFCLSDLACSKWRPVRARGESKEGGKRGGGDASLD